MRLETAAQVRSLQAVGFMTHIVWQNGGSIPFLFLRCRSNLLFSLVAEHELISAHLFISRFGLLISNLADAIPDEERSFPASI